MLSRFRSDWQYTGVYAPFFAEGGIGPAFMPGSRRLTLN